MRNEEREYCVIQTGRWRRCEAALGPPPEGRGRLSGCRGAGADAWGKMVREARLAGCEMLRRMGAQLR